VIDRIKQCLASSSLFRQCYAFDNLVRKGKQLGHIPLADRREVLKQVLHPSDHLMLSVDDNSASHLLSFVKKNSLEGLVAKRADSTYEPGRLTRMWSKHRLNQGQEFVIGSYMPGTHGFDALIIGFYRGNELIYAARVREGFNSLTRHEVARIDFLEWAGADYLQHPKFVALRKDKNPRKVARE
jgi:ATP-dependent DNA ligase